MTTEQTIEGKNEESVKTTETVETSTTEGTTQVSTEGTNNSESTPKFTPEQQAHMDAVIQARLAKEAEKLRVANEGKTTMEQRLAALEERGNKIASASKKKAFSDTVENPKLFSKFEDEIELNEDGTTNVDEIVEKYGLVKKQKKLSPTHSSGVVTKEGTTVPTKLTNVHVVKGVRIN